MIAAKLATRKREDSLIPGGPNGPKLEMEISISSGMTSQEAADLLNVDRSTVYHAKMVQREGSQEEVATVEAGEASVSMIAKQIRAKMPVNKRQKKRDEPLAQTGKNPQRIQRLQINAEIWGRVRDERKPARDDCGADRKYCERRCWA